MIIQGTPEWHDVRRGKITASKVADLMSKTKTGWGASRANYMAQLIAERLTGVTADGFSNSAMQWGTETEPQARGAYTLATGNEVAEVAFVDHPDIAMCGCSPDGLVGEDGMVEIKCPNTATHLDTLLGSPIDSKYIKQMQWQMACTGRKWCDFVSFDPRMPVDLEIVIERVQRDDMIIAEMTDAVNLFIAEMEEKLTRLGELVKKGQ